MKRCVAGGSLFLLGMWVLGISVLARGSDEEQIQQLVENYVVGWREADVERLERVFAPEGRVMWVSDASSEETLRSMTFAQVLERRKPQPQYGLEWSIQSLDIVGGRLAVAKVRISRAGGSYVDFLVCQKIAGHWKIINKTFLTQ